MISPVTSQQKDGLFFAYDFSVNLSALHPQLVDLGLRDVSPLLLDLTELGQVDIGLFLL